VAYKRSLDTCRFCSSSPVTVVIYAVDNNE
jgi:hypothetical protein